MLHKLRALFGRKPALIKGTSKLANGHAKKVVFGDPIAGNGIELILCRVEGELHALDARCPHEGGRINEGPLVDEKYAQCPLHGYLFEPATGAAVNAPCKKAKRYRVREVEGDCDIWI
jgi:nitrite reductase/ring-hydroxylating ferredoxin subunit